MSNTLFEDLVQGLNEAIAYEKGEGKARTKTYTILPIKEYSGSEIRSIRKKKANRNYWLKTPIYI